MKSKQALLTAATIFLLMNEVSATSLTVNVAGDANYTMGGTFSGTSGDLRGVLNNINLTPDTYQVTFALTNPTITPLAALPVINLNTGNMVGIDGSNGGNQIVLNCSTTPGFFAAQGTVSIENMTIENGLAQGGAGGTAGYGGSGGLGAGAALFIDQASVTVSNLNLSTNTATGGQGGALVSGFTSGGGGGGMGGNGGANPVSTAGGGGGGLVGAGGSAIGAGGGGGGIGIGGNGSSGGGGGGSGGAIGCNGGNSGATGTNITGFTGLGGGGGGGGAAPMGTGGNGGGGGAGGTSSNTGSGGGGGGGGTGGGGPPGNSTTTSAGGAGGTGGTGGGGGGSGFGTPGGNGGNAGDNGAGGGGGPSGNTAGSGFGGNGTYGGGGGGGGFISSTGGDGGFGGGGGGGGSGIGGTSSFGGGGGGGTTAGTSGFGAGGAGSSTSSSGGVGGGNSTNANGAGGAGLGGGIFVNSGGTLLVQGPLSTSSNTVVSGAAGGAGANSGAAVGTDIFARTGNPLTFSPGTGQTVTLTGTIADDSANSLPGGTYTAGTAAGASLTMSGAGELLITGNNIHPYAGGTTITAGTLFLNGTFSSSTNTVTVNSGGTFSGNTPTVAGNVSVANGATLAGGSATSQMVIDGTLTLNSTSITSVEINPSSASLFTVGTVNLAGNVSVVVDPGSYPASGSYNIVDYTNKSAAFNPTVQGGATGFTFSLNDTGTMIQLLYQYLAPTPPTPPTPTPTPTIISVIGLTGNDLTIAKYLNKSNLTSQAYLDLTKLSGHALKEALSSVSPTRNADGIYAAEQTMFALSEMVTSHLDEHRFFKSMNEENYTVAMRLADASDELLADASDDIAFFGSKNSCKPVCCIPETEDYDFWIGAFGELSYQKAQDQSPAFNFLTEGVLAAFDYYMDRGFIGGGLGYAHTHLHEDNHAGKASINYGIGTVYGGFDMSHFYMDVALLGVYNHIDNHRFINFPGFSATASAKINGWQFDPHVDLGYDVDYDWGCLEPFAAVDWANSWQRGYHEHGADSLNMSQGRHHSSLLRTEAGLKLYEDWQYDWGSFLLKEKLSWVYKKPFGTGSVTAAVVGGAGFFTVESLTSVQNLGAVGFEFLARIGKRNPVSVGVAYAGEFGKQYQSHEVLLSVTKDF